MPIIKSGVTIIQKKTSKKTQSPTKLLVIQRFSTNFPLHFGQFILKHHVPVPKPINPIKVHNTIPNITKIFPHIVL